MSPAAPSISKRSPELDGVRGLAVLMVVLWHYVAGQMPADAPTWLRLPITKALGAFGSGVDLFFVLSGFLICGILLDNRDAPNYFRVFYLRRICRIFPLYYLVIGLFALMLAVGVGAQERFAWLFDGAMPLWRYLTFTQNIAWGQPLVDGKWDPFAAHWLGMTWSLAVEEQFYLALPAIVFFVRSRANLVRTLLFFAVLAIVLRAVTRGPQAEVGTLWRADALLTGALLAVAVRHAPTMQRLRQALPILRFAFIVLLIGFIPLSLNKKSMSFFSYTWLALLYGMFILLPILQPQSRLARFFRGRLLVWLGTISYGIYMYHEPISGLLHGLIRHDAPQLSGWQGPAVTALALAATLTLATASYRLLEKPLIDLGHSVRYATPRAKPQPDASAANPVEPAA